MKKIRRTMGAMEIAQALTGRHYSFNVVVILQMVNGPLAEQLKIAANLLLNRHPILSASIVQEKQSFFFQLENHKEIKLNQVIRNNKNTWQKVAEEQLNTPFDSSDKSLMRLHYITSPDYTEKSEIIITFHHVVVDAASGGYLVDELLNLCTKEKLLLEKNKQGTDDLTPPAEIFFPSSYQGIRRKFNNFIYMMRMMGDEIRYRIQTIKSPKAPIHLSGHGKIIPMILSKETTTLLWKQARKTRITIKNIFDAALLMVIHKHLYNKTLMPLRFFTFADLRPFMKPPLPSKIIGSYFSMLRFTTNMSKTQSLTDLARLIQTQVYTSLKRGDKFAAHLQSPGIMKALLRFKSFRMGNTAISYIGQVNIKHSYGNIKINHIHVFNSNFVLGPEYTAQTRLFKDRFYWDILYLDSDMDENKAKIIAEEIKNVLKKFCSGENP